MSALYKSLKRGLTQAIEHASGKKNGTIVYHRPRSIDIKSLRSRLGMTQEQFAATFGFAVATLRHWERGDRMPHGPALVLLNVIHHNPNAVIEALTS